MLLPLAKLRRSFKNCRRPSRRICKSLRKLVCMFVGSDAVCFGDPDAPGQTARELPGVPAMTRKRHLEQHK